MPSVPLGKVAQAFRQCQFCFKEQNTMPTKLLCCSKCHRSHYCSKACQVSDWPQHKSTCRNYQDTRQKIKEKDAKDGQVGTLSARDVEARLKKWISIHRPLLQSSVIQALQLQLTPDRVSKELLTLTLSPNPKVFSAAVASKDATPFEIARSFTVDAVFIQSIADLRDPKPDIARALDPFIAKSHEMRAAGGVGMAVVATLVPSLGIMHMTPFGMPEPITTADVALNPEWEAQISHFTERGIVI